jgi:hypothetical protein
VGNFNGIRHWLNHVRTERGTILASMPEDARFIRSPSPTWIPGTVKAVKSLRRSGSLDKWPKLLKGAMADLAPLPEAKKGKFIEQMNELAIMHDRLIQASDHCYTPDNLNRVNKLAEAHDEAMGKLERMLRSAGRTPECISLQQAAELVGVDQNTLRRWLRLKPGAPAPAVEGGRGKPYLYEWGPMRHWLQQTTGQKLPKRVPG